MGIKIIPLCQIMKKFNENDFLIEEEIFSREWEKEMKKISDGKKFYEINLRGDNLSSEDPHIQGILDKILIELKKMDEIEGEDKIWEKEEWKENFLEVGYWGDEYGNFLELDGIGFISGLDGSFHIENPFPLYEIIPIKLIIKPFEEGLHLLPIEED